jgi:hypothetical protein
VPDERDPPVGRRRERDPADEQVPEDLSGLADAPAHQARPVPELRQDRRQQRRRVERADAVEPVEPGEVRVERRALLLFRAERVEEAAQIRRAGDRGREAGDLRLDEAEVELTCYAGYATTCPAPPSSAKTRGRVRRNRKDPRTRSGESTRSVCRPRESDDARRRRRGDRDRRHTGARAALPARRTRGARPPAIPPPGGTPVIRSADV